ncbi:MAG TPA: DUF3168 domain-containing protein [Bauldia sp.]|nr:DUF3168 domain-containing protein [Bauldia sp.]
MTHPSLALQKAIVAALIGDSAVGALIGDRIWDAPPRDATFPYLTIGQVNTTDWSTGSEDGAEHQLTLHAWSRERGKRECYAIAAAVEATLHDAALTLQDHALVNLRFEFAETRRDPDGITYHCAIRFRAVTEPT